MRKSNITDISNFYSFKAHEYIVQSLFYYIRVNKLLPVSLINLIKKTWLNNLWYICAATVRYNSWKRIHAISSSKETPDISIKTKEDKIHRTHFYEASANSFLFQNWLKLRVWFNAKICVIKIIDIHNTYFGSEIVLDSYSKTNMRS